MQVWDEKFPPQLEHDACQIGKALLVKSPLFAHIGSDSLARCLYWIVSIDAEVKSDAKAKPTAKYGASPRDFRDLARKIDGLASKAERYLIAVPLFLAPPRGITEMLQLWHSYAKQLRQTAEYKTRMMEGRTNWGRKNGTKALLFLAQTVWEKTGKPQFQQTADLLTETSRLLGVATQYNTDAIKMRVQRKGRTVS
jgi:hypothetical protein